jgi:hypothetical protein
MSAAITAEVGQVQELLAKLPPSERDFEVFEWVVVEGGTTRGAAAQFGISQTRVCQLLERVRDWLSEVLPAADDTQTTPAQLALAESLAADRLDYLYGQAVAGWKNSDGKIERTRIHAGSLPVTTVTTSQGDPRYLSAAARIAMLRSKLTAEGVCVAGAVKAAAQRGEDADANFEESAIDATHPVEECSNHEARPTSAEPASRASAVATPDSRRGSGVGPGRPLPTRTAFFAPVQRPELGEVAAATLSQICSERSVRKPR